LRTEHELLLPQRAERGSTAKASSTLKPVEKYAANKVLDRKGEDFAGNVETAWCEGVEGDGKGEWIEIAFPEPRPVAALLLSAGYDKSTETYANNSRINTARLLIGKESFTLVFGPHYSDPTTGKTSNQAKLELSPRSPQLFRLPGAPRKVRTLRIELSDIACGDKFADACLSTVVVFPELSE
jgi:hypothetical protein